MKEETGRLDRGDGVHLAWRRIAGRGPGVVFLGGFNSDMTGSKAEFLAAWCAARGQAFLRFDYSGHGTSEGRFEDGTIGRWAEDAACVIAALTEGPQILIGSSMGGWIALLLAARRRVPGENSRRRPTITHWRAKIVAISRRYQSSPRNASRGRPGGQWSSRGEAGWRRPSWLSAGEISSRPIGGPLTIGVKRRVAFH